MSILTQLPVGEHHPARRVTRPWHVSSSRRRMPVGRRCAASRSRMTASTDDPRTSFDNSTLAFAPPRARSNGRRRRRRRTVTRVTQALPRHLPPREPPRPSASRARRRSARLRIQSERDASACAGGGASVVAGNKQRHARRVLWRCRNDFISSENPRDERRRPRRTKGVAMNDAGAVTDMARTIGLIPFVESRRPARRRDLRASAHDRVVRIGNMATLDDPRSRRRSDESRAEGGRWTRVGAKTRRTTKPPPVHDVSAEKAR